MKKLYVQIEIEGKFYTVGRIIGNNADDACFEYTEEYLENKILKPISISLPKAEKSFSPYKTRCFFEGLLPEGFVRRSIASNLHIDESDYISILEVLGKECIGAVRITDSENYESKESYEKLTLNQVKSLAKEGAKKSAEIVTKSHLSLAGASGKVGLMYHNGEWYQPMYDAASSHIIKQSHVRLDSVVLNEHICLLTAKNIGLDVVESAVINVGSGRDEDVLFVTKRYDRKPLDNMFIGQITKLQRLHQEDFSQAMGIPSILKYERPGDAYLVKMANIIRKYSSDPIEDILKLWDITVFNYLIGNTDNHIKNHGLLYSDNMQSLRLAPAYDILSTCIYDECTRNMSYSIGGKISLDEINRDVFIDCAKEIGLGKKMAMDHFDKATDLFEDALWKAVDTVSNKGFDVAEKIGKRIVEATKKYH